MNASKENAQKALENFHSLTDAMPEAVKGLPHMLFLKEFLEATRKRLPTEFAIEKDRQRKRRYLDKRKLRKGSNCTHPSDCCTDMGEIRYTITDGLGNPVSGEVTVIDSTTPTPITEVK